jgi:hypothetical protein
MRNGLETQQVVNHGKLDLENLKPRKCGADLTLIVPGFTSVDDFIGVVE